MTIRSASSGKGRCNALASSYGARIQTSRSSSVVRITGIALVWIGSTMAFGAVEDRSQPMCASGYAPRLDPKTLPFYVPSRVPVEFYPAPQPVVPKKPKVKASRPGWFGWLDVERCAADVPLTSSRPSGPAQRQCLF